MRKRFLFKFRVFLISFLISMQVMGQSVKDIRINEIMVINTDGFKDKHGHSTSWIELYNKGYNKVNLAGCFLKVNGKEYQIPRRDPATVINTRGYMVFFAGGTPEKGTFHTNFKLDDTDFIEFYDSDGMLIDRFEFDPAENYENVSYGWFNDGYGKEMLMHLPVATPGACNNTLEIESRSELFRKQDPSGIVLTVICTIFVAITLVLLFFIFKYMGNYYVNSAVKKKKKATSVSIDDKKETEGKKGKMITNDELAAVAIALYKYKEELHDSENLVLTINKASKAYSPWSSKIYGLRQYPIKKNSRA